MKGLDLTPGAKAMLVQSAKLRVQFAEARLQAAEHDVIAAKRAVRELQR